MPEDIHKQLWKEAGGKKNLRLSTRMLFLSTHRSLYFNTIFSFFAIVMGFWWSSLQSHQILFEWHVISMWLTQFKIECRLHTFFWHFISIKWNISRFFFCFETYIKAKKVNSKEKLTVIKRLLTLGRDFCFVVVALTTILRIILVVINKIVTETIYNVYRLDSFIKTCIKV